MSTDKMREEFEAWYDPYEFRREYDKYGPTEAAYFVWQAARSTQPAVVKDSLTSQGMIDIEKLVPLPEPGPYLAHGGWNHYTASDMAALRADVARAVAKRCAEICTNVECKPWMAGEDIAASAIAAEFGLEQA